MDGVHGGAVCSGRPWLVGRAGICRGPAVKLEVAGGRHALCGAVGCGGWVRWCRSAGGILALWLAFALARGPWIGCTGIGPLKTALVLVALIDAPSVIPSCIRTTSSLTPPSLSPSASAALPACGALYFFAGSPPGDPGYVLRKTYVTTALLLPLHLCRHPHATSSAACCMLSLFLRSCNPSYSRYSRNPAPTPIGGGERGAGRSVARPRSPGRRTLVTLPALGADNGHATVCDRYADNGSPVSGRLSFVRMEICVGARMQVHSAAIMYLACHVHTHQERANAPASAMFASPLARWRLASGAFHCLTVAACRRSLRSWPVANRCLHTQIPHPCALPTACTAPRTPRRLLRRAPCAAPLSPIAAPTRRVRRAGRKGEWAGLIQ